MPRMPVKYLDFMHLQVEHHRNRTDLRFLALLWSISRFSYAGYSSVASCIAIDSLLRGEAVAQARIPQVLVYVIRPHGIA